MEFIDYYKVLGITKSASDDEIKKSYRKLARKLHPDLNPDDKKASAKFKQVNEANTVLSNPKNREKYDNDGKDWESGAEYEKYQQQNQGQQNRQDPNSGQQSYGNYDGEYFSDFFSSMFGQSGAHRNQQSQAQFRGQDINVQLSIAIKDVFKTHKKEFTVNDKNIRITIPAGIKDQQTIKIKGLGNEGAHNGPKGDLFITFSIVNNTPFKRVGNDLYLDYDLAIYSAIWGGEITVSDFDSNKLKLKVSAGTQSGTKIKLKGKGFPIYKKRHQFGDLYVTYNIKISIMEQKKKIMVQCIITIPVSKVWNYWTEPRHIMNWNVASEDYHCPSAQNDLREEGTFSYTMALKNGKNSIEYKGTYIEIISQKLLKYEIEDGRVVTINFSEQGNETAIIQSFEAVDHQSIEEQQKKWNAILQNFKRYCEDSTTNE
jgi:curved DNA-binding protein